MSKTAKLALPNIVAAQALKHITHNEALRALDAIVQIAVLDRHLSAPPVSPNGGDSYIVAAVASGAWAGKENQIAAWQNNAWAFYQPNEGWLAWVADENKLFVWDSAAWNEATQRAAKFGVNATADVTNRLSISAPASLFNHEGAGHQVKLNKNGVLDTASFLFQTGFSGHAEIGLTGDDNFHFKVSPDGASWKDAIIIDDVTGLVSFPFTPQDKNLLFNGDFALNQRSFAGGALAAATYGHDRWKADANGANYSLAGDVVTLTSGTLVQIIESPGLAGEIVTIGIGELTGGNVDIDIAGQAGTISAGAGRVGATLGIPPGSTGNITLKITPTSGAVTFKQVQLERGNMASLFAKRPAATELALCQRYFEVLKYSTGSYGDVGNVAGTFIPFNVQKRVSPTMTMIAHTTGGAASYNSLGYITEKGYRHTWSWSSTGQTYSDNVITNADAEL